MKIDKFTEIEIYLDNINVYVKDTCNYLENPNSELFDKSEIIAYLSTVPETISDIKKILEDIETEVNINEQLY